MVNILIVDDSVFQRKIIKDICLELKCKIIEANHGDEAIKKIQENTPDCILTDLIMPGDDGLKYIRQIREDNPEIPIIVITADIQETTRKGCLELGVKAVINKPVKTEDLHKVLQEIL